jgi:hypothetical protein
MAFLTFKFRLRTTPDMEGKLCRLAADGRCVDFQVEQENSRIKLPKLGWVRYRNGRELTGTPKNVTVSQHSGIWYVSIQTSEISEPIRRSVKQVGGDRAVSLLPAPTDRPMIQLPTQPLSAPVPRLFTRSFFKVLPWRSEPYKAWVKTMPCLCCGMPADDPHHEQLPGHGGMGTTPGDDRVVPLCRRHHDERQTYKDGGAAFWLKYGKDVEYYISRLNAAWERLKGDKIAA